MFKPWTGWRLPFRTPVHVRSIDIAISIGITVSIGIAIRSQSIATPIHLRSIAVPTRPRSIAIRIIHTASDHIASNALVSITPTTANEIAPPQD